MLTNKRRVLVVVMADLTWPVAAWGNNPPVVTNVTAWTWAILG